jgi:tape measure domain-containing protein
MAKNLEYTLKLKDLFSKTMQGAAKETAKLDDGLKKATNRFSDLRKAAERMQKMNEKARIDAIVNAKQGGGGFSALGGLAAGIGVGALAKEMVTTGAQFDSYKARLETMLGSSLAANNAFNQIKEDAAKTPFDVGSLTQANAMLISAGSNADDARSFVMNLGNAIASTGGGSDELTRMAVNLQQIKTLGKASALDVKQFAFAGIPIYQMLAKTMGKTVAEVRSMDVTYEQLASSFGKAAEKGGMFYNGLAKQSAAVGGQISNLKDQFTNTLVDFYESAKPMITSIISLLSKLLQWVQRNKETVILIAKIVTVIGLAVVAFKAWALVNSFTLVPSLMAVNAVLIANPIGAVIIAVTALIALLYILIGQYKTVQELHSAGMQKNMQSAFNNEKTQVDLLITKYEKLGYSKEKAASSALRVSKKMLAADLSDAQRQLAGAKTDSEKRIAQKRIASLGGRNAYLQSMTSGGGAGIGGGAAATGAKGAKSLGTGTEVTGARPQAINININELVHELNIQTTNLTEGAGRMKELVSKALLETVNDINLIAMA